jgi:hypothetical protein
LQPVSECEFHFTSILEQLQLDPWPVANDKRPLRSTGTAMAVSIGLIEVLFILYRLLIKIPALEYFCLQVVQQPMVLE